MQKMPLIVHGSSKEFAICNNKIERSAQPRPLHHDAFIMMPPASRRGDSLRPSYIYLAHKTLVVILCMTLSKSFFRIKIQMKKEIEANDVHFESNRD
jgi:hypothetical protein